MRQAYRDALEIAREALNQQPAFSDEYDATLGIVAYLTFAFVDAT